MTRSTWSAGTPPEASPHDQSRSAADPATESEDHSEAPSGAVVPTPDGCQRLAPAERC
jgi:hypothetical protein